MDSISPAGKCFSSGIVLGLAFTHVLFDAVNKLQNPCLTGTWQKFPWAFFIAALGVVGSLSLELLTVSIHELITGNESLNILAQAHHHEAAGATDKQSAVANVEPANGELEQAAVAEIGLNKEEAAAAMKALRRKRVIAEVKLLPESHSNMTTYPSFLYGSESVSPSSGQGKQVVVDTT